MKHLDEIMISSESIYKGKIFEVTSDVVELENGKTAVREVLHHNGGVGIVPLLNDGKVILVKQFRYPFGEAIYEIPAGKKEKNESPLDCGKRELIEETGYYSENFTSLGEVFPIPAYNTQVTHIFLAENLQKAEQNLDEDEFLDIEIFDIEEIVSMIMNNIIKDAKTQIAILKTYNLLKSGKIK